ncbi:MAG TPA: histidine kinase [Xanthomonadales bacterium]|nr:histidine kinase [Xanthomonadales bacterium]
MATADPKVTTTGFRWFLLAFIAWSLLSTIPTSSAYIAEGSNGLVRWLWIFGKIAPFYYMWALATPLIYRVSITILHPDRGWLNSVLGHCGIALVLSFGFGYIMHFNNWQEWLVGSIAPGYYAMSAFSYMFILLGIYFYQLHERVRKQDAQLSEQSKHALQLEANLARSQVERLRGQMNPHFLFNALNCIGSLIDTGRNDRAYLALEDLGGLLRTSLEHRDQELVALEEELAFTKRYLAMEQMRFGDRLQLEISVDSAARQWSVPPFLLQPLIENVVRHTVAPTHRNVTIELEARRNESGIEIVVTDDGGGTSVSRSSDGTGVGLDNLQKRLDLIYGYEDLLAFRQDANGTRVKVTIPEARKPREASNNHQDAGRQDATRLQTQS